MLMVTQQLAAVGLIVNGTMVTRFLPFLLFPAGRPTPKLIQFLGKFFPAAVFGLLFVIYFIYQYKLVIHRSIAKCLIQ